MITIENLEVIADGRLTLSIDHLCINSGEKVALIGTSGSGKTTLIECISGLREYTGVINSDIKDVSFLPQKSDLIANFKVKTNVLMGRFGGRSFLKNIMCVMKKEAHIDTILSDLNILDKKDRFVKNLSGGEAQRVLIARTIYEDKNIALLDEPTSALDIVNSRNSVEVLLKHKRKSTVVCAIHNLTLLDFFDRVIVLKEAKIVLDEHVSNVEPEKIRGYFD